MAALRSKPAIKKPAAKQPAAKQPAAKQPAAKKAAAKQPAAKKTAAKQPAAKQPANKKPAAKQPAAKKLAAKKLAAKQPAAATKQPAPATKQPAAATKQPAAATRPAATKQPGTKPGATKQPGTKPAGTKPAATKAPPAPPRFAFEQLPVVSDPSGLTALLRRQLVVDVLLELGRTTTADRIPTSYFTIGIHRWRVTEGGQPCFDVVQNTAFFVDSDEPLGIERVQGCWEATGRYAARGRTLDLHHLAWEFNRDWPGRRLPLDPEPERNRTLKVIEGLRDQPWPADATFV
ncbi:MAG: hypothetical protein JNK64_42205 [Myxococcales bacterium]|nr:hypothetical protein [Myxococcales bacterium]